MTNKSYIFLAAAALLSLSSLPGFNRRAVIQSASLSSSCDAREKLLKDGKGDCRLKSESSKDVSGTFSFHRLEGHQGEVKVIVELESQFCADGTCRYEDTVKESDFRNIAEKAYENLARRAQVRLDENKAKERAVELCEKNTEGVELKTLVEQMNCRADRLIEISDEQKANAYYREHLKNNLLKLLNSVSPQDRADGLEIVNRIGVGMDIKCSPRQLPAQMTGSPFVSVIDVNFVSPKAEEMSGKGFIKESMCDMASFAQYTKNQDNVASRLAYMRATGARPDLAEAWEAMANSQKLSWGEYYTRRGIQIRQSQLGSSGEILWNDISVMNRSFDARLARINQAYRGLRSQSLTAKSGVKTNIQSPSPFMRPMAGFVPADVTAAVKPWPTELTGKAR